MHWPLEIFYCRLTVSDLRNITFREQRIPSLYKRRYTLSLLQAIHILCRCTVYKLVSELLLQSLNTDRYINDTLNLRYCRIGKRTVKSLLKNITNNLFSFSVSLCGKNTNKTILQYNNKYNVDIISSQFKPYRSACHIWWQDWLKIYQIFVGWQKTTKILENKIKSTVLSILLKVTVRKSVFCRKKK